MAGSLDRSTSSPAAPVVLVLGDFVHEGVKAKVEAQGFELHRRQLRISPRGWARLVIPRIRDLVANGRLAGVIGYLPTPILLRAAGEAYRAVAAELIAELEKTRTLLFVHEENLAGRIEPLPWEVTSLDDWRDEEREEPANPKTAAMRAKWLAENARTIAEAQALLDRFCSGPIDVIPFKKRSDVTIRLFDFLEELQSGTFLRLYVPHGRCQSEQFEDFLTMLSRYLRDVEGTEIAIDVHRTRLGSTSTFKSAGATAHSVARLREAANRLDGFLVLAQRDPRSAERALVEAGRSPQEACFIVAEYARGATRLNREMRQESERRLLVLRHELETDVEEGVASELLTVPDERAPSGLFSVVGNAAPVSISFNNTLIAMTGAQTVLQSGMTGDFMYSKEDEDLLAKIAGGRGQG